MGCSQGSVLDSPPKDFVHFYFYLNKRWRRRDSNRQLISPALSVQNEKKISLLIKNINKEIIMFYFMNNNIKYL